jgi:HD-like signal output (HDOD) protein/CheY-like chemotaxis protein
MTAAIVSAARTTVLVVDDMQICREPIAEILRARGLEALCASNGEEALRLLAARPIDLVLLDVKMPGMDGLSVLRAIRSRNKQADLPVLLLTDLADRDTVRAAAAIGVQGYLLKSEFTADDLTSRVRHLVAARTRSDRVSSVHSPQPTDASAASHQRPVSDRSAPSKETRREPPPAESTGPLSKDKVLARIRQTLELRPVPPVLHHVASMTADAHVSMHDIVDVIRQDQALALRVLKIANSSFYTTGSRAHNLLEAAGRLGMNGIRNAVVTVVSLDQFTGVARSGLIPQRFWEHSLATAAMAKSLAAITSRDDGEEIFLAALLHDVGRLVLAAAFPAEYRQMLETSRSNGESLDAAERHAFKICHSEITRIVLQRWNLAAPIIVSAALHEHDARELQSLKNNAHPATIVALSDRLAHAMVLGDSGDARLFPLEPLTEALGLSPGAIGKIGREAAHAITDMELFYACQGDGEFLPSFAAELASVSELPPRVTVLAKNAPHDALSLFFGQLGWLNDDDANVAAIHYGDEAELHDLWSRLQRMVRAGAPHSVLFVAAADADVNSPSQGLDSVRHRALQMPVYYRELVGAVRELAQASPTPDAALG